jgi:hypothetical protein
MNRVGMDERVGLWRRRAALGNQANEVQSGGNQADRLPRG